jgi:anaerobic magnesium-protoporphyrin IX monomethyl ester cyclase
MRILLFSMPDSFEHTPSLAIRIPNGGLASLAGNLDAGHHVAIADLILAQSSVRQTVERLVRDQRPDLVGLSVMTYQRGTARRIISLVRALRPQARIVVGGYDPSLAPSAYFHSSLGVDFIVRGEGDLAFRELVRALSAGRSPEGIPGVWCRTGAVFSTAPPRPAAHLDAGDVRPPLRAARVLDGYTFLGRPIDVIETSRGCTFDCSFCSIIEMRGRNFHRFPLDHVIADIADARDRGARAIFIVDDNVTLDVPRFESICERITEAGLNDVDYLVQAMTASIAAGGDRLASKMRAAGFRYVFLGIENVIDDDLKFLKAQAKNRERGSHGNATIAAIDTLHRHGMYVVGGLIVGNPDDTAESIEANLSFARRYVDWPYIQHPTPYPGTPMTADFITRRLIANPRLEEYDGTTAVTHARIDGSEIEFARWKAERWMKVKHMPTAFAHDPRWIARHAWKLLAHTFRGSSWRSALGLEDAREVFERYRAIRVRERQYLDWPDPLEGVTGQVGGWAVG